MKIVLVSGWLAMGGAERAMIRLLEGLTARGHDLTLITVMGTHQDFYDIDPAVKRIDLNLDRHAPTPLHTLVNAIIRIRAIRKALQQASPDVVVSFLERISLLILMAKMGTALKVVASGRNVPVKNGFALRTLSRILYPRAAAFVSVSNGVDEAFSYVPASKRVVINNVPADVDAPGESHLRPPAGKHIVSAGRLSEQKNFELLVRAFHQLAADFPDWYVTVMGDGEKRADIEAAIQELGLEDRVFLPGKIRNPFPTLKAADLFVFSSNWEGVPNAVLEAMACGLAVITTDYLGEPRDIIRDGENGLIVPRDDVDALAASMRRVVQDDALRSQLAEGASRVREELTVDKLVDQWEAVFRRVTG